MKAMLLDALHAALRLAELPMPQPGGSQVRLRVRACGVCRTDLHVVDGELSRPKLPLVQPLAAGNGLLPNFHGRRFGTDLTQTNIAQPW